MGTVWDGLGQKRGFGCWKLAAFYRHLDQPAQIPFPQRSSTRIILTGCAWSPFPGGWCRSDTRLCSDLRPGTFQGPAFPAIPSRASGQAWAGTSPGSPLLGHGTEVTETAAGKAGEIKREQLLPKRLVGRPCTDAEPGAARPRPPRGSPGSRDSSRPFSHSLHPSIHPSIHRERRRSQWKCSCKQGLTRTQRDNAFKRSFDCAIVAGLGASDAPSSL